MANEPVVAKLKETLEAAARAFESKASTAYDTFDWNVRELEVLAREDFQAKLGHAYLIILNKLEKGEPLTSQEWEMVNLLVIGEAKYYLQHENDFENWQAEIKRLVNEMEQVESSTGLDDVDSLLRMRALCRDARGVLSSITYYLQEKERVDRFKETTGGALDLETGRILADVIRGMMTSDKM